MDDKRLDRFFNTLLALVVTAGCGLILLMVAGMTAEMLLGHDRVEELRDQILPKTKRPVAR